jgi:hypothetical protein
LAEALLRFMAAGTAELLEEHGVITPSRELTSEGASLVVALACDAGVMPPPRVRALVAQQLAARRR